MLLVDETFYPDNAEKAKFADIYGGICTVDNGCPSWGTANTEDIHAIGDSIGNIVIEYVEGTVSKVPVIFGYTLWYKKDWIDNALPFRGDGYDPEMQRILKETLCVCGGYEKSDVRYIKIRLEDRPLKSISYEDSPLKNGKPVIEKIELTDDAGDEFFATHTIDASLPLPRRITDNLKKMYDALVTYISELDNAPTYVFPGDAGKFRVRFGGTNEAKIATGIFYENLINLSERIMDDGMLHTSYRTAPSWWYEGFGAYGGNIGSYYNKYYSRDGGRAIMTLNSLGYKDRCEKAVIFGGKCMMYYPDNNLSICGKKIPGHYSVMINEPMIYSTYLVPYAWWPTQYTEERFGDGYQNLGNQETDGHGLMMLANYNTWKNLGESAQWVKDNIALIDECVKWIEWCFDNPDVSLAKGNILYAESEAGMNEYTLYCNVPCCLGVLGSSEMVRKAGMTEKADRWQALAEKMKKNIEEYFTDEEGDSWKKKLFGFIHCPVVNMLSDVYGYDTRDFDADWVRKSDRAYDLEIERTAKWGYIGAAGIGYDHSMITQASLLLDKTEDYDKLVKNISLFSYAPGRIDEYIIPEGITVDWSKGTLRRQGDLGNLVQQAECLKNYMLSMGVSPVHNGTLKIMPRLPKNWTLGIEGMDLQNANGFIDYETAYPENGTQKISLQLHGTDISKIMLRFGPFREKKEYVTEINGTIVNNMLISSGDAYWVWAECDELSERTEGVCR